MSDRGVHVAAPAKVNLWLRVGPPDASGYHPLDTLFCALDLADDVLVRPRPAGLELRVEGADLGAPRENLAWRAAEAFLAGMAAGSSGRADAGVAITLRKRVPAGAGLGGGSSDAAATLRALSVLHDAPLPDAALVSLAAQLGADVPFFLCGSSLARGTGYGERLEALPPLPAAPVLVAVPPQPVSTADAYALLDRAGTRDWPPVVGATAALSWDDVARASHNDFESVILERIPELAGALDVMTRAGARVARLAGSGSAVFGVFHHDGERRAAQEQLSRRLPALRLLPTRTRTAPPAVERHRDHA